MQGEDRQRPGNLKLSHNRVSLLVGSGVGGEGERERVVVRS